MALTYEVCQLRDTSYGASADNSSGKKSCTLTLSKKFLVKVTDPANSSFGPDNVTDLHAAYAPGIPIVNYHTWYDANTGASVPMAVCSNKSVRRMEANGTVFEVTCTFKTEGSKQSKAEETETPETPSPTQAEDISSPSDIAPVWTRSVSGRDVVLHSAVAYDSTETALNGGNAISTRYLPVDNTARVLNGDPAIELKNEINQPITKKLPMLQFTITQFEETVTDANLLARCWSANLTPWNTGTVTYPAKSAMITAMNAVKQSLTVAAVGGGTEDVEWYRVSYTVLVDDYTVQNSTGSLFVGHAAAAPLIGHWHENQVAGEEGKAVQFQKSGAGIGAVGLLDFNGRPKSDQDSAPDYVRFNTVEATEFNDFFEARP